MMPKDQFIDRGETMLDGVPADVEIEHDARWVPAIYLECAGCNYEQYLGSLTAAEHSRGAQQKGWRLSIHGWLCPHCRNALAFTPVQIEGTVEALTLAGGRP